MKKVVAAIEAGDKENAIAALNVAAPIISKSVTKGLMNAQIKAL
jgi:ribosomal protein S20